MQRSKVQLPATECQLVRNHIEQTNFSYAENWSLMI